MMGGSYVTNPIIFLIQVVFGAYILVVMLRFLLQWVQADFYNPASQFIVKVTTPALLPLRRIIPGIAGLDIASVVLMWLLKSLELGLIIVLSNVDASPISALAWSIPELISLLINVFLYAILIQVIISWINPGNYNPLIGLLHSLTEPLLGPARRMLPAMGGLDLSPMLVMIGLVLLKMLLLPPIQLLVATPFR
ncbi:MAG: YggT family protein [Gammaproteobacteria bacterium]|nr:YggT family protein [Gammaproteobacteria bacterium]